ncbi:MAG: hypothetical protein L0H64_13635 [Pseudonocardia sp.]|nr:hypothetical protein [Pseudonocardia sp.]
MDTTFRRAAGTLLLALALPAVACGTSIATPRTVLLDEPFDDDANGWGGSFQSFVDGAYVWDLPPSQSDARAADALIALEQQQDADVGVGPVLLFLLPVMPVTEEPATQPAAEAELGVRLLAYRR